MLKGREIRGLPVFAGNKHEEVGRVTDLVVNDVSGKLEGIVVSGNGLLQKSYYVALINIRNIDKNGIIVPNKANVKKLSKKTETLSQKGWLGSKLYSPNGIDKGTVADILVKDGQIKGLEISTGIIGDLHQRRDFIPWDNVENRSGVFVEEYWG